MQATRRQVMLGSVALAAAGAARAALLPAPDPSLWSPPPGVKTGDGFAPGPNGPVYYRRFGEGKRLPLIALHGGPAAAHGYMLPYAQLARDREVVLYDQSGCGRSAAPADLARYTVNRYVDELEALRAHLGFDRMLLLGHSWGGMLAPAYTARHRERVKGLVLAGTAPRWMDFQEAGRRWLAELGPAAIATVRRAEATGKTDDPAYGKLLEHYYALHVCRLREWPKFLNDAGEALARNPVYTYLNGPSEFQFTGAFAPYDGAPAARAIRVPTLITCGEYDEGPPWVARKLAGLIPGARVEAFAGLSHMSHIEDPARVLGVTRKFLATVG